MEHVIQPHTAPCATLQDVVGRVGILEHWQRAQNGTLGEMKEMLGDSREERQAQMKELDTTLEKNRNEANRRMDDLYRLLVGVLITMALSGLGLIAAHITGKI